MDSGAISSQQGRVGTRQRKALLEEEWELPLRGKGARRKILRSLPLPWSSPLGPPTLCLKAKCTLTTTPLGLEIAQWLREPAVLKETTGLAASTS